MQKNTHFLHRKWQEIGGCGHVLTHFWYVRSQFRAHEIGTRMKPSQCPAEGHLGEVCKI